MSVEVEHVELRAACRADAVAVAEIWYRGWCDGHLGNVPDALVAVRTRESFAERAPRRLADTTVAVVGGEVAGFVMVVDDEVEQVYVAERHRGVGVAAVLLEEAERLVAAGGHRQAWLAVVPGNARARRFYERNGWTDQGPFEQFAPRDQGQVTVPAHRYVKRLADEALRHHAGRPVERARPRRPE
ncbi:GNAT family N-acetyltransferase [Streptomyces griseofuscus]|uniref:GNAT family N-acetyltransferase n=1 Tax=Streptomyces griseofuscus TaxID=146922 RepID=A0A3R8QGB4_9ACTN|nr:GNAT family N-acetyltransferase [Streptomyces griseofuscus]RRQ85136.1 GNAT family N-acetyltransferase [Streptomyces griseofuscus]